MTLIGDLAATVRSKNAEPFITTVDLYFTDNDSYRRVKDSGRLTTSAIAERYCIPEEAVFGIFFVDSIRAIKISMYKYANGRYLGQGDTELGDMFGAQQHVPLLELVVD